ncbi:class I SAM-dependent methyltransferase [Terasakiella sp. SH-1]|uniref:class I SAM-dependent methyltransferase n=1 Tax=Terasakiella sp. SH-1 TaxID=2560057 RepID=UPI0010746AD4|nr:class I SAM-dependent methyltransferase [Terasakiella sp. SH-1]
MGFVHDCRVCGGPLYETPLLCFENMPAMAQNFPDDSQLAQDHGQDLTVCQCSLCGLVQLDCPPVPYYKEVIRAAAFSEEMRGFRREQFADFVSTHELQGKKVLEVGCGKGEYLELMQEQGVQAHGIEGGLEVVQASQSKPYHMRHDFLEKADQTLSDGPYDAFFMLNYLEHLPNPNETLRAIAHNLYPGAVGLVEVPNFDMIIRAGLFSEFINDHLFYFTKETLSDLLTRNGFELLDCSEVWHDYCLSAVVKKRQPSDLSHLKKIEANIKKNISDFLEPYASDEVALWGAGHQALANISLLKLQEHIAYVVDSAPFKQNKYTPATHVPIVPPDRLREHPVKAVIVMAASYSDEVASLLRRDYSREIEVAILREHGLERVE